MQSLEAAKQLLLSNFKLPELLLLGPSPAPFSKMSNYFRYHFILKGLNAEIIHRALDLVEELYKSPTAISSYVDVDPVSLM
jgi:primosomal protein N' (replication factor Y)